MFNPFLFFIIFVKRALLFLLSFFCFFFICFFFFLLCFFSLFFFFLLGAVIFSPRFLFDNFTQNSQIDQKFAKLVKLVLKMHSTLAKRCGVQHHLSPPYRKVPSYLTSMSGSSPNYSRLIERTTSWTIQITP